MMVQDEAARLKLAPETDTIVLYDDGRPEHGDAKADDGVYSAVYRNTYRPGNYDITVSFNGSAPGVEHFARSESRTITVRMTRFDMAKSAIDALPVDPKTGRLAYEVSVTLVDEFGNFLGPGHSIDVLISPPGKQWGPAGRRVSLDDNLDGSYSGRVELTPEEAKAGSELRIVADGTAIYLREKRIVVKRAPLPPHSLSLHLGRTAPIGAFGNDYDPGLSVTVDYDYHFAPQLAAVILLGYHEFDPTSPLVSNNYWWNLSGNLKYESSTSSPHWYANGGLGFYFPKTGSAALGYNLGVGLERVVAPQWLVGFGTDYHRVFTGGSDTEFYVPYVKAEYRF
jgi:hypothetical protein